MKATLRPAYAPSMKLKCRRPFVLSGHSLTYDDPVPTDEIEVRRLRQMYEARLVDVDERTDAERAAHMKAKGSPAKPPASPAGAQTTSEAPKVAPAKKAPSKAAPDTAKAKVKSQGFGKFGIINPATDEWLVKDLPNKAAAEAELPKFL